MRLKLAAEGAPREVKLRIPTLDCVSQLEDRASVVISSSGNHFVRLLVVRRRFRTFRGVTASTVLGTGNGGNAAGNGMTLTLCRWP
jgi:hypothetical protein